METTLLSGGRGAEGAAAAVERATGGSSSSRQKGRGWWRRTGRVGGKADRGSSRGWRSCVIHRRRSSNRGAAPTLGNQK
jgi:hypothetical protein